MDFFKYQGAGNDFVIVNNMDRSIQNRPVLASHICDRRYGVGADGFIAAEPSANADIKMAFYNADGSEAGMCGNGIRCFAKYVTDAGIVKKSSFSVETGDGIRRVEVLKRSARSTIVRVDMGELGEMKELTYSPTAAGEGAPGAAAPSFPIIFTHIGVPHAVIFQQEYGVGMKGLDELAETYGYAIEHAPAFAMDGTNVNFVSVVAPDHILCSTWERGAGKTLACGTGACSAAAAARAFKGCEDTIRVSMPGGDVKVSFDQNRIYLEGRGVLTFVGSAPEF